MQPSGWLFVDKAVIWTVRLCSNTNYQHVRWTSPPCCSPPPKAAPFHLMFREFPRNNCYIILNPNKVLSLIFHCFYRNCMSYFWSYKPALDGDHEGAPVSFSVCLLVESSWNVMAHGDAWEEKWRGNWRMEWEASTFHTTSEHYYR